MLRITPEEIKRWRAEIDQAEAFRDDHFGKCKWTELSKAGENIDYFESGISGSLISDYETADAITNINIVFAIVKHILPTLYWKNPYISALPKRAEDEDSAPCATAILNYFYEDLDIKEVNRQVVFDAYVLGMGVSKIGYSTQFGTDIPDESLEKEREKKRTQGILEKMGIRKPKKEEEPKQNVELNEYIKTENPYVTWVNPFEFGIDPRANSIYTARYVYQKITKLLNEVKENKNYSNTKDLRGTPIEEHEFVKDIPSTQIEKFKTIDLYEIHYKTDEGINILTLAKDQNTYKPLRHEKSIYEMDGFQYEILTFNKHSHRLYPKSDISIIKGLQDRINQTLENILDQVDKYVPKIAVDENALTEQGKRALRDGDIGSIVYTNKNPGEVVKEINFTQLKGDLAALIDKVMDIVMLETGLTKAQLMGMTRAETATEAQIQQSGANLRLSDKFDYVSEFSKRQARKLWQVVRQFVDLEELQLIVGEQGTDDVTNTPKFSWLAIDPSMSAKLGRGEYRFSVEVGSSEKPDLPILRKQVENLANILMGEGVLQAFAMQGKQIDLGELLKRYMQLFPDVFKDPGKIIKSIPPQQAMMGVPGGATPAKPQQAQAAPPNIADIISEIGGEKGGPPPLA